MWTNSISYCVHVIIISVVACLVTILLDKMYRSKKSRLRDALNSIMWYIEDGDLTSYKMSYKDKEFFISVIKDVYNSYLSTYNIYINNEHTAKYHCLCSSEDEAYCFEEVNNRYKSEVETLIYKARKAIEANKRSSAKAHVKSELNKYSYFN